MRLFLGYYLIFLSQFCYPKFSSLYHEFKKAKYWSHRLEIFGVKTFLPRLIVICKLIKVKENSPYFYSLRMLIGSNLTLRNIPKLAKWNLVSLRNVPSPNSKYCLPKYTRWNLFEFEQLSFPKLTVLLPQVCLLDLL